MRITALKQSGPDRVKVCFADGTEICSAAGPVTELRLFAGKELDEEQQQELLTLSRRWLARDRAIEMVSRRRMSRKELTEKLLRKGEDEETAAFCADWLEERGFLDDEGYAAAVARHYSSKGYGAGRVRAELSRRGVSRELWEDALEQMPDSRDKLDRLVAAKLKDPEDREQVRKLSASLARRGFSWEEIRAALRRCHAETEDYD